MGALATALVLVVFLLTKFIHGAWIVVVVVPLLVLMFRAIHHYYSGINAQMQLGDVPPLVPRHNRVIIPVVNVHRGMIQVLEYALGLSRDVQAVYVEVDPAETAQVLRDWERLHSEIPLKVLPSPYRAFVGVLIEYINTVDAARGDAVVTVLLPEFVTTHWWQQIPAQSAHLPAENRSALPDGNCREQRAVSRAVAGRVPCAGCEENHMPYE